MGLGQYVVRRQWMSGFCVATDAIVGLRGGRSVVRVVFFCFCLSHVVWMLAGVGGCPDEVCRAPAYPYMAYLRRRFLMGFCSVPGGVSTGSCRHRWLRLAWCACVFSKQAAPHGACLGSVLVRVMSDSIRSGFAFV